MPAKTNTMPPVHPGETLRERDFLKPLRLTANRLATEIFVPVTRINDIVRCRRAITADTALRLARYFGTTPQFGSMMPPPAVRSRATISHNRTSPPA
jgi:addiction module HigA family antidote